MLRPDGRQPPGNRRLQIDYIINFLGTHFPDLQVTVDLIRKPTTHQVRRVYEEFTTALRYVDRSKIGTQASESARELAFNRMVIEVMVISGVDDFSMRDLFGPAPKPERVHSNLSRLVTFYSYHLLCEERLSPVASTISQRRAEKEAAEEQLRLKKEELLSTEAAIERERAEADALRREIDRENADMPQAVERLNARSAEVAKLRAERDQRVAELDRAQALVECIRLRGELAQEQRLLAVATRRNGQLREDLDALAQREAVAARAVAAHERLIAAKGRTAQLEGQIQELDMDLRQLGDDRAALNEAISQLEARQETLEADLQQETERRTRERASLTALEEDLEVKRRRVVSDNARRQSIMEQLRREMNSVNWSLRDERARHEGEIADFQADLRRMARQVRAYGAQLQSALQSAHPSAGMQRFLDGGNYHDGGHDSGPDG
ncbi:hypothetical protein H696_01029 [Fonticula alba]|uniref:Kinetochore protein Nuf2 N-terminal domain-containing protein n=1 Tax=Fonticula alba TaxID=691883 RepID=A0A058ZCE1_FONAL|nr:hypothetical protein H696_01029 [Fonticula alba]KCV71611.1 hypothetical protein H696_01029 [Fonticula alba]|eukprot:XP_009493189.1 hypothetical protein H696_01029 [Fonticula alba]